MSVNRRDLAEVFRSTAEFLKKSEQSFNICYVIHNGPGNGRTRREAGKVIMERLAPHAFYQAWLAANYPPLRFVGEKEWQAGVKSGRIAWCEALAKEFSE